MIKIEKTDVCGWEAAIRGMRNPMNSWDKSDSLFFDDGEGHVCGIGEKHRGTDVLSLIDIGDNDLALMQKLIKAGSDHRKFMRQIFVSMDITAPLYWWKEFDTYKVGTVANSCSTMHTIHKKEFTLDDFSTERMVYETVRCMATIIDELNDNRKLFLETGDTDYWYSIIQLLPTSYNQLRTVTMNYENLLNMYHARRTHKLDEWRKFCEVIKTLPYAKELITDVH